MIHGSLPRAHVELDWVSDSLQSMTLRLAIGVCSVAVFPPTGLVCAARNLQRSQLQPGIRTSCSQFETSSRTIWNPQRLQLDGAPAPCLAQLLARVLSTAKPQLASANAAGLHPRLAGLVLGSASSTFQLKTRKPSRFPWLGIGPNTMFLPQFLFFRVS
jgi:hypothetical protein